MRRFQIQTGDMGPPPPPWQGLRVELEKKVSLPLEGAMEKFLLCKGVQLYRGKKLGLFPTVAYKIFFIIEGAQVFPFLFF